MWRRTNRVDEFFNACSHVVFTLDRWEVLVYTLVRSASHIIDEIDQVLLRLQLDPPLMISHVASSCCQCRDAGREKRASPGQCGDGCLVTHGARPSHVGVFHVMRPLKGASLPSVVTRGTVGPSGFLFQHHSSPHCPQNSTDSTGPSLPWSAQTQSLLLPLPVLWPLATHCRLPQSYSASDFRDLGWTLQ